MPGVDERNSMSPAPPEGARYAGWATLVGVLGIALIMIGIMLVAMLQATVVRPGVVITGFVLIGGGLALLPVAWRGRRPKS
jgi:hypothetical protein